MDKEEKEVVGTRLGPHPIRCGCMLHTQSDDVVGCPVYQVERLTALVAELEKLLAKERGQATQADSLLDLAKQVLAGEGVIEFQAPEVADD